MITALEDDVVILVLLLWRMTCIIVLQFAPISLNVTIRLGFHNVKILIYTSTDGQIPFNQGKSQFWPRAIKIREGDYARATTTFSRLKLVSELGQSELYPCQTCSVTSAAGMPTTRQPRASGLAGGGDSIGEETLLKPPGRHAVHGSFRCREPEFPFE